ncbi:ester cyclase [Streptomyces sp. NPDC058424]|uniref:ester cyclase n=1 Tax=Streptomyces sp. NPDC058424 TaxID=3346491 RepID=UPI00365953F2
MLRHGAFADHDKTLFDQIAEGNAVATRWRARGHHTKALLGKPPSGRYVTFCGLPVKAHC